MSDITELFHRVTPTESGEPSAATVDADVVRGRGALAHDRRRRTIRRSMAATTTVAAAAVVVLVASQLHGSSTPTRTNSDPRIASSTHGSGGAIKLVDYTGPQLAGFTVDQVPDGWRLSTSTQFALLIDPDGSTDNDPSAFEGKLAVLTSSIDEHGLGAGDHVTVNGEPGVVSSSGKYGITLKYDDPKGFGVDIQAPAALHWTDDQIVAFADGVHVTADAVHSRG